MVRCGEGEARVRRCHHRWRGVSEPCGGAGQRRRVVLGGGAGRCAAMRERVGGWVWVGWRRPCIRMVRCVVAKVVVAKAAG